MGWMSALSKTYDNNRFIVGEKDDDKSVLLPLGHSTANAQVEIVIDTDGKFLRARAVDKEDTVTIIPVTEDSCTRGSGVAPHPLCDKLCYIAGDYSDFKSAKDNKEEHHEAYISALEKWASRATASEKIKAIYQYLSGGTVIKDLISQKLMELDESGYLKSEDLFVRFVVEKYLAEDYVAKVWEDVQLFREYEIYYMERKQEKNICYVSGMTVPVSEKHPAKIRNTGDKAKLISSNDTSGYTFRGRFAEAGQVVQVGYETSQKAHNALRWLIQKQGYRNETATIISWSIDGISVPDPVKDTQDLFADDEWGNERVNVDVGTSYAKRLNRALAGYRANLKTGIPIVVMAVDTADGAAQGRLAVTFYSELEGSDFLNNIEAWHRNYSWRHTYKKKGDGYVPFIGAPSLREIALAAYGTDQNGLLKADAKVIKNCVERLLPCIVQRKRIPKDIIYAMVRNAGRPMSMSGYNWSRILSNTCAVLVGQKRKQGEEEWSMSLNKESSDRSYLFGRLLAVANKAEERTYEGEKGRVTNAKRYWSVFPKKPAKTWGIIAINLEPYLRKLGAFEKRKYEELMNEILSTFKENDFSNIPVDENYLLGFGCQMDELRYKENQEAEKNEMEEEENE